MDKHSSDWQKEEDALQKSVLLHIARIMGLSVVGVMMILAIYRVVVFFNEPAGDTQINVPSQR